jgi:thiamine biosynthesis lipoprotein
VTTDHLRATVEVRPGVELDLGATGKGLAADLVVVAARDAAGPNAGVLVSLGGDLATAGEPPPGGWRVRVGDDSATPADAPGEVIELDGGAIATSSTTVRRWSAAEGVALHHIIDPRTGLPAETPWRTASVVADTCERANAASTAAIVMGGRASAWLARQQLPARLVARDGSIVRIGGWPEPATNLARAS